MSAALTKELLLDYGMNLLSLDTRTDLSTAIQELQNAGVFNDLDIIILHLYLSGYTSDEIKTMLVKPDSNVDERLYRIINAISFAAGYTDEQLIKKVDKDVNYARSRIAVLRAYLQTHGEDFTTHTVNTGSITTKGKI